MPKYFHFRGPDSHFDGQLVMEQCRHTKANGVRCKRHVVIGLPYCFQHRKRLKVGTSTIPNSGLGLFADNGSNNNDIVFQNKDEIIPYYGQQVTRNDIINRYGTSTAPYGIQVTNANFQDGALKRGLGTLVNHKSNKDANVRFSVKRNKRDVGLVATKRIRNKQELFVNYGKSFKLRQPRVFYSTNHSKYSL